MLKKEVKRMQWNLPEVQPAQRDEAKYLLGITDEATPEVTPEVPSEPETPETPEDPETPADQDAPAD